MPSPGAPPGSAPAADGPAETGTGPPEARDYALLCPKELVLDILQWQSEMQRWTVNHVLDPRLVTSSASVYHIPKVLGV